MSPRHPLWWGAHHAHAVWSPNPWVTLTTVQLARLKLYCSSLTNFSVFENCVFHTPFCLVYLLLMVCWYSHILHTDLPVCMCAHFSTLCWFNTHSHDFQPANELLLHIPCTQKPNYCLDYLDHCSIPVTMFIWPPSRNAVLKFYFVPTWSIIPPPSPNFNWTLHGTMNISTLKWPLPLPLPLSFRHGYCSFKLSVKTLCNDH